MVRISEPEYSSGSLCQISTTCPVDCGRKIITLLLQVPNCHQMHRVCWQFLEHYSLSAVPANIYPILRQHHRSSIIGEATTALETTLGLLLVAIINQRVDLCLCVGVSFNLTTLYFFLKRTVTGMGRNCRKFEKMLESLMFCGKLS